VYGEVPSAAKWNILGANDASFNDGTGIGTDAVRSSSLYYGLVRNRQGSTTGDNSWQTPGTNNTATDAKNVFIQCGSVNSNAGADVTVTFPTAYTQIPIVVASVSGATLTANAFVEVVTKSTTTFDIRAFNTSAAQTAQPINWIAIGQ